MLNNVIRLTDDAYVLQLISAMVLSLNVPLTDAYNYYLGSSPLITTTGLGTTLGSNVTFDANTYSNLNMMVNVPMVTLESLIDFSRKL